jgi:response regulator RpfG family c-di-GMP phosphodiesterase
MISMSESNNKILLVDNEPLIRKLTRTTLDGEDLGILEAENGQQAVEIASLEKPRLVLLDINLPDMDGFEVCSEIRKAIDMDDTHIILLTSDIDYHIREKGMKAGADDFFTKPFSPIELLKKVHKIFEMDEVFTDIGESETDNAELNPDFQGLVHTPEKIRQMKEEQLLLYALDISRLHKKEHRKTEELKQAYKNLKEIEKMKDMFIALVSHELRTPLSVIKGYLYLLQEVLNKSPLDQEVSGFMKPISKSTERLEELIGELLDFSRMKSGLMTFEKREISIPNILNLILKEFSPQFSAKNISVTIEVQGEFRPVKADYERLREAFSHLIHNALKYTEPGGSLKIECADEGIWIELRFIDTGTGIPKNTIDKIFNPFYQSADFLTREVGGMGLGLSISKHVIEDHGGTIQVESEVGKGSVFKVRLPRSYQDAREIVAELKQTYPRQIEELSKNLKDTQEQLLLYAQELSSIYAREKMRTEQLERTLNALEMTYIQTIAALSRSVDVKDAYICGHSDRVSFCARTIAEKINPELLQDRNFKYSLLLHDIGKIGVAEEILRKVDKLTEEEWHVLREHPQKGVELLKDIEFLSPALSAVRSHHERWDGKGYPDGLKGEQIPLAARIIAVADSFDAMITDRPYRKGMSIEEAKEEISRQAGHQFDPEVVKSFFETWHTIEKFTRQLSDICSTEEVST